MSAGAKRPSEGKKTTIIWMIGAAFAVGMVLWRVNAAPDAPETQTTKPAADRGSAQPAAAPATPPPAPLSQRPPPGSSSGVVSKLQPKRGQPPKLPGVWFDIPARTGTAAATVVALHGRGDTARNFGRIAASFAPQLAWRVVQAPLRWNRGFRWFDSAEIRRSRGVPLEALDLLKAHVGSIDGPVVLLGFSQGCMTILHAIAKGVDGVRAAACYGGWVVGEPQFGDAAPVPLLFVSGAADQLATPEKVRAAIQLFENHHKPTEHIEHAGGHSVPHELSGRVSEWLIRKGQGG